MAMTITTKTTKSRIPGTYKPRIELKLDQKLVASPSFVPVPLDLQSPSPHTDTHAHVHPKCSQHHDSKSASIRLHIDQTTPTPSQDMLFCPRPSCRTAYHVKCLKDVNLIWVDSEVIVPRMQTKNPRKKQRQGRGLREKRKR